MLLFIASHLDAGEQPSQKQLADDSRMSVRQVPRIVDALELSGELKVDRSGGHISHNYSIPTVESDNDAKLSTLNKKQHGRLTAPRQSDGVSQTDTVNDAKLSTLSDSPTMPTCHDNMATLPPNVDKSATSNDDKLSGTPVAPYSAKNTSTDTEANASGAKRGADAQAYIGRLLKFRRKDLGVKNLPVEQGEAAAAKWMHSQGWPLGSVGWCYRALKRQHWRGAPVTLITVKTHYPDWKQGKLSDGKRTETQPRVHYGGKPPVTRDYSKFGSRT